MVIENDPRAAEYAQEILDTPAYAAAAKEMPMARADAVLLNEKALR